MILPYDFYSAWQTVANTPSEEFKDRLQALIDSRFDVSTSVNTIEEETVVGSNIWNQLKVRLTHKINVDTGVRLSDDWRVVIFQDATHVSKLGIKFKIDTETWLTLNTENKRMVTSSSLIRRCNWTLKWYNKKGILIQEPCIVEYVKMIGSAMGTVEGKQVREGSYDRFVYVQANTETGDIERDQRFFIDDLVFRVTKRDTIAHNGLIEFCVDEHQYNPEVDDIVNKIADYTTRMPVDNSNVGITEIFVGETTIAKGTNAEWSLYKKSNGVVQPDTYVFSIVGTGASIISYTGNTVALQATGAIGSIFVLRATNNLTSVIVNKTIQVVGMW